MEKRIRVLLICLTRRGGLLHFNDCLAESLDESHYPLLSTPLRPLVDGVAHVVILADSVADGARIVTAGQSKLLDGAEVEVVD